MCVGGGGGWRCQNSTRAAWWYRPSPRLQHHRYQMWWDSVEAVRTERCPGIEPWDYCKSKSAQPNWHPVASSTLSIPVIHVSAARYSEQKKNPTAKCNWMSCDSRPGKMMGWMAKEINADRRLGRGPDRSPPDLPFVRSLECLGWDLRNEAEDAWTRWRVWFWWSQMGWRQG